MVSKRRVIKKTPPPENAPSYQLAVFESGGKQYLSVPGEKVVLEKLQNEKDDHVKFDRVLLAVSQAGELILGEPFIPNFGVMGKIEQTAKGKKVEVRRFRAKSRHRRHKGHRQWQSRVKIEELNYGS